MATNFGTKIVINAYKCISVRDNENVITYNRGFLWSTNQRRHFWLQGSTLPCTKVLSQEIQIFQETSFYVLQVLLRNFTNTLWQLYIDFYTIRMVFESSFQLCTFKIANLKMAILAKMCR